MKLNLISLASVAFLVWFSVFPLRGQNAEDGLFDSPDQETESRLHEIFRNYNAQPMSDDQWAEIAGDLRGEEYLIQSGDSLWSISKTLFDDGFYWPKVWALNAKIENPHAIEPGHALRFYEGDFDQAPSVSVVAVGKAEAATPAQSAGAEGDTAVTELKEKEIDSNLKIFDPANIVLPPPASVSRPVMKDIPASIPNLELLARERAERMGRDLGVQQVKNWPADSFISSFMVERPPLARGRVIETELNIKTAAVNQIVYLKINEPTTVQKGTIFAAYRPAHNLFDLPTTQYASFLYSGEIMVLEKIRNSEQVYRGVVRAAVNPVWVGDELRLGKIPKANFYVQGGSGQIDGQVRARIVGGEYDETRRVFAAQSLVYLDKGSEQGIRKGLLYDIISNLETRGFNKLLLGHHLKIGVLKIVDVSQKTSTAIVVEAFEEIRPGDFLGSYTGAHRPLTTRANLITPQMVSDLETDSTHYVVNDEVVTAKAK